MEEALVLGPEVEGASAVAMVVVSVAELELAVVFMEALVVVEGLEVVVEEASAVGMVEALVLDWV